MRARCMIPDSLFINHQSWRQREIHYLTGKQRHTPDLIENTHIFSSVFSLMLKYSCKTVLNSVISTVGENHLFPLLFLSVAVEQ